MHHVQQLIDGQFVDSNTSEWIDITDPATQEVIAKVPQTTDDEINQAVAAAQKAFQTWRKTPITTRARIFLKYQELIREHMDELAEILTAEQGKTIADARGDVFRGLEVVEHAARALLTCRLVTSLKTSQQASTPIVSGSHLVSVLVSPHLTFPR